MRICGRPESTSGPGSGVARTAVFRDELSRLLKEIGRDRYLMLPVETSTDEGDQVDLDEYVGVDIVAELTDANQRKYGDSKTSSSNWISQGPTTTSRVIFCRDCLVHFSFRHIIDAIQNFKRSGSRFLLTTTFIRFPQNADIQTGGWRQINLEISPFNFPGPLALIDEKCTHSGGIYADKRLALWKLDDISM